MNEFLNKAEIPCQLGFSFFSILFFYIVYNTDTFNISSEEIWDYLRYQYQQLYQQDEIDKKCFPSEMASFCYKIQEKITSLQWEYIYYICLTSLILMLYSFFFLESGFLEFGFNIIIGAFVTFYVCYFINNVYIGTVLKIPIRTDPLRWAYGNGFFLTLFCLGIVILSILSLNYINQKLFGNKINSPFMLGGCLQLYFRREYQSIFGRSLIISSDLSIKENFANEGVMDTINYSEKIASIMGQILSDSHLYDLLLVMFIYFTIPQAFLQLQLEYNYFITIILLNYLIQFVLSFFISSFQSDDKAQNVLQNVKTQIIIASLFSILSLAFLSFYSSIMMSIASFGLIASILLIIYLEYVTNHSYPQVRNIASAAINAPMLNILYGFFLGDMGQLFVIGFIALFTFISKEIGGTQGIFAFITGLLMNLLVMASVQFSGNSIMIGLKFAQIAQVDSHFLERINLATCNYGLYLKIIITICMFQLVILIIPLNELSYFSIFFGIIMSYYFKGLFLSLLQKQTIHLLRSFGTNSNFDNNLSQLWELLGILAIQFIILMLLQLLIGKQGTYSYLFSFACIQFILQTKSIITGSSLKNVRILEGTLKDNQIVYLSHLYADIQGISIEESTSLPQISLLGISLIISMLT